MNSLPNYDQWKTASPYDEPERETDVMDEWDIYYEEADRKYLEYKEGDYDEPRNQSSL